VSALMSEGRKLVLVGALGAAVCAGSVLLTLSGAAPAGHRPFAAVGHALTIGIPIAVGLYAWHRRPQNRFGKLLVAAGFGWSLTTLAESSAPFAYSLGRVSLWAVEPVVLYLVLAFPSGRLTSRVDRALVASAAAIVAVLFLPTALLVDSYPPVAPLSGCTESCPANFFMLTDSTPAFVDPLRAVREILITLVFVAVAVRLLHRISDAPRLVRRTVTPVLAAAIVRFGAYGAFLFARRVVPGAAAVDVIAWVLVFTLPGIAVGFLIGLFRWRLHVAEAMEHLARRIIARPGRAGLDSAVGEALEDPKLELAYWAPGDPGTWVGSDGAVIDVLRPEPGRAVTQVRDNGHPAVALVHDAALNDHQDFVDAAASLALVATENERLAGKLRSSLRELEESRTRIVAAADRERRRIERDLHDGAQQHLVALRIKLEVADELMDGDQARTRALLHEVESEIDDALDEVRSLARGIYPSLLADRGLQEALRAASLRIPVPTTVKCENVGRYSPEVESAVYFSCLEALQNAVKHARGATALMVVITSNGELRFEIRDDGEGFDTAAYDSGQGLTNMRDRLAAVGGRLAVSSTPGEGTEVCGVVPAGPRERRAPLPTHMRAVWREQPPPVIMDRNPGGAN
jgi:signal transduction histidine kinase